MIWHNLTAEEALSQLGSSPSGLAASEATQRLTANGPNELAETHSKLVKDWNDQQAKLAAMKTNNARATTP